MSEMSGSAQVRVGVSQAEVNSDMAGAMMGQIFAVAIIAGIYAGSWGIGGATLFGLLFGFRVPYLGGLLLIVLSLGWAAAGAGMGYMIDSTEATWVLGIIGLMIGLGVNIGGRQFMDDLAVE